MAHEITSRDGVFAVRKPMWHGLGTVFEDYPTREEAQALAHPWEPVQEPLYRRIVEPVGVDEDGTPIQAERYEEVDTAVLNARSDDGYELGAVSKGYVPVTNGTLYDIAEAIEGIDKGSVLYETGGSLAGGRKVWVMLRLRQPIVVKGDPNGTVIPFFALQNAHDGSGAFRGQAVADRIVCANTARLADYFAQQHQTEFAFSHTKNVADRIEEAKRALAGWREQVGQFQLLTERLMGIKIPHYGPESTEFTERFIPMPARGIITDRVANNVEEARSTFRKFLLGPTCEGIASTGWGHVSAAVEYLNWGRRAHTDETRFRRSMLERQEVVTKAVELAELVGS